MQKLVVLLLSLISTVAVAEELMTIEREKQLVHFVYPLEDNKAYYYVAWSANKNSCQKINSTSKKLIFDHIAKDRSKFYRVPKKGGFFCLYRSELKLDGKWKNYSVIPSENYLIVEDDESRGFIDQPAQDGVPDESDKYVLSCIPESERSLERCGVIDFSSD